MSKSIKEKLREQQQQNHEQFRRQLVEDVADLLQDGVDHMQELMDRKTRENKNAIQQMDGTRQQIKEVSAELKTIRTQAAREIKQLKQRRTWKTYLYCFLCGLLGSFVGIALCGAYWPTIMWLLGQ